MEGHNVAVLAYG